MKKLIVTICLIAGVVVSANAQFHIELGLNGNLPQGDFADLYDLGVGLYIEPRYAINENIDVGLHIGTNGFAGGDFEDPAAAGANAEVSAAAVVPILATGHYRFSTSKISPYAGLGLGIYSVRQGSASGTNAATNTFGGLEDSTEFGFSPRAGLFLGRMNLGVTYHLAGDLKYLQFGLGFRILSRD